MAFPEDGEIALRRFRITLAEVAAVLFYLAGAMMFYRECQVWRASLIDDAFISFRYAENLAGCHGLVWNIGGPPTEGYTSPLLLIVLLPWMLVGGPPLGFMQVIGIAVSIAAIPAFTVWAVGRYGWRRHHPLRHMALLLAGLPLFMYPTAVHALSGMETALVLAVYAGWGVLIQAVWERSGDGKPIGTKGALLLGLAAFVVALARSESGAVAVAGLGALLIHPRTRKAGGIGLGGFLALLAAYLGFKLAYFGYILPNPFYHKVTSSAAESWAGWPSVADFSAYAAVLLVTALAGLLAALANRRFFFTPLEILSGGSVIFYLLFFLRVEPLMNYDYRFSWHCLPYLLVLTIGALWRLAGSPADGLEGEEPSRAPLLVAAAAVPVIAGTLGLATLAALRYDTAQARERAMDPTSTATAHMGAGYTVHERVGKTLGALKLPYSTLVNGSEAGLVPYYARTRAIDLAALNDNIITRGTPEEKRAYLAANPIDVDFDISTTGELDDVYTLDPSPAEIGRRTLEKRINDYYFVGSFHWGAGPRRFFNWWVRRSHPDASRIREAMILQSDVFHPLDLRWGGRPDDELFRVLEFPGMHGQPLGSLVRREAPEMVADATAKGLKPLPYESGALISLHAVAEHPYILNSRAGKALDPKRVQLVSYDIRLRTVPTNRVATKLYWAAPGEALGEQSAMSRPLALTTEWQTVTLPVGCHPRWYGLDSIETIRFDMVNAQVDFDIRLPAVHVLPQ